ncbi:Uncharacterized protein QTN25_009148 [Entamoeba marina]
MLGTTISRFTLPFLLHSLTLNDESILKTTIPLLKHYPVEDLTLPLTKTPLCFVLQPIYESSPSSVELIYDLMKHILTNTRRHKLIDALLGIDQDQISFDGKENLHCKILLLESESTISLTSLLLSSDYRYNTLKLLHEIHSPLVSQKLSDLKQYLGTPLTFFVVGQLIMQEDTNIHDEVIDSSSKRYQKYVNLLNDAINSSAQYCPEAIPLLLQRSLSLGENPNQIIDKVCSNYLTRHLPEYKPGIPDNIMCICICKICWYLIEHPIIVNECKYFREMIDLFLKQFYIGNENKTLLSGIEPYYAALASIVEYDLTKIESSEYLDSFIRHAVRGKSIAQLMFLCQLTKTQSGALYMKKYMPEITSFFQNLDLFHCDNLSQVTCLLAVVNNYGVFESVGAIRDSFKKNYTYIVNHLERLNNDVAESLLCQLDQCCHMS